jgi:hypothetical protein
MKLWTGSRGVEAESSKAVGHAIFGNVTLRATGLKTRPTGKSLDLIQRYRRVRETLEEFPGITKVAGQTGIETSDDNLPTELAPFDSA